MRRGLRWKVLVVAVGVLATAGTAPAAKAPKQAVWKAGLARAKITPDQPLWLAGYAARQRPAEGKLHDLWIKVLALEDARGRRAVVVTADLLGFPKAMADAISAELQRQQRLRRAEVMLACSHTHSGPVLSGALLDIYPLDAQQLAMIEEYSRNLQATVVKAVGEAIGRLGPATVWTGEGMTDFAVNRRNNSEKDVIEARQAGKPLQGPSDHSVPVMAVRSVDGRLLAVLFIYACHATTLADYEWSGDYAGFAQIALEEKHPDTQALFVIGCGADQNPLPRRSVALCKKYGTMLADAVEAVLAKPMKPVDPELRTAFDIVRLDFQGEPSVKQLEAEAAKAGYSARWAKRILKQMAESKAQGKALPRFYPYPVQVWRLGQDQLWIALGGEVVVDYALSFKSKFGPTTWVTGYANDVMAYIPSSRVWKEGGYESGAFSVYGLAAERWAADIEQRITQSVQALVEGARQPAAGAKPPNVKKPKAPAAHAPSARRRVGPGQQCLAATG